MDMGREQGCWGDGGDGGRMKLDKIFLEIPVLVAVG
jgi:hypothetical protein